jgi:SNF2 family DNA or RNA helicase
MDQWEKEIHRITPGLRVVQHHGAARTDDPKVLARNDVVITSYTIVANEFETKAPAEAENKAKKKKAAKAKKDDFIASDDELEVDYLKTSKKTAPKKKKMKCALFGVMWWRIILGPCFRLRFGLH